MIKIPIFKRTTIAALEFKFKRYQGVIEAAAFTAVSGDSGDSFGVFRVFRLLRFCLNTGTPARQLILERTDSQPLDLLVLPLVFLDPLDLK